MSDATAFASQTGGRTIGMTRAGIWLSKLDNVPYKFTKPLWQQASRGFAKGARGNVSAFHNAKGVKLDAIWRTHEYPWLKNFNNISYK